MTNKFILRRVLQAGITLTATAAILGVSLLYAYSNMPVAPVSAPTDGEKTIVVVDAGHGGFDGGSVSRAGTVEAPLNLAVAACLQDKLTDAGLAVVMTRTDGEALGHTKKEDMAARRRLLNTEGAVLCVSVHMNAVTDRATRGPMAFYMKGSAEGERLAQLVIDGVCNAVSWPQRPANPGDYFVVRECACPAVLIECGFLTNAEDEKLLMDAAYQQKLAAGITQGVLAYLDADNYNVDNGAL